jgi:regulator of protease activity HflC (stomatin/prohibitin superfamily)
MSLEKISDDAEKSIVAAAVRRGVIHAAASMTADEVLYDQPSKEHAKTFRLVKDVAKEEAQKFLDEMQVGIKLRQFERAEKMPPRSVAKEFGAVQTAQAEATAMRTAAEQEARQKLATTAGESAPLILSQIDRYDAQLGASNTAEAEKTLQTIHDLMQRKPVTIDGKEIRASVSGEVSKMLSDAAQYATSSVTRAQGDSAAFTAKLAAFRANPQVYLSGEWTDAYSTFSSRESVQMMLLPPGLERLVLMINQDPEIEKDRKQRQAEIDANKAIEERNRKRERDIYERKLEGTSLEGMNAG